MKGIFRCLPQNLCVPREHSAYLAWDGVVSTPPGKAFSAVDHRICMFPGSTLPIWFGMASSVHLQERRFPLFTTESVCSQEALYLFGLRWRRQYTSRKGVFRCLPQNLCVPREHSAYSVWDNVVNTYGKAFSAVDHKICMFPEALCLFGLGWRRQYTSRKGVFHPLLTTESVCSQGAFCLFGLGWRRQYTCMKSIFHC